MSAAVASFQAVAFSVCRRRHVREVFPRADSVWTPSMSLSPFASPGSEAHHPVLLEQVLEHLAPTAGRRYLDCTLGAGGHSEALLAAGAAVLGIDRDGQALEQARARLAAFAERFSDRQGDYAAVAAGLIAAGERFDGVLADIGVSSMQLDDPARGFSIRSPEPLDLRMDRSSGHSALECIDAATQDELADWLFHYGEERRSRRVARALKQARRDGLASGEELAAVIRKAVPGHHKRHPALRSFQALRIVVNDELGQLRDLLGNMSRLLRPGGCAVIISFHSLEDRLVKEAFREGKRLGTYATISKRVLRADPAEQAANRRSIPAKLRWARSPVAAE